MEDKVIEYFVDTKNDFKQLSKNLIKIIILSWATILIVVTIFLVVYVNQQDKFVTTIEKQQKDFITFLNQYDFSDYAQDGDGTNYLNRNVGGDVTNGAKTEGAPTQGLQSERTNDAER